jgi:hypothetical protein
MRPLFTTLAVIVVLVLVIAATTHTYLLGINMAQTSHTKVIDLHKEIKQLEEEIKSEQTNLLDLKKNHEIHADKSVSTLYPSEPVTQQPYYERKDLIESMIVQYNAKTDLYNKKVENIDATQYDIPESMNDWSEKHNS